VAAAQLAGGGFAGAMLQAIEVDLEGGPVTGLTLAGVDLTGAEFLNFGEPVALPGADLTGADLTDVSFAGVDLTGAVFSGADFGRAEDFSQVRFSDSVICPDGLPADPAQLGPAACRLG
jgi:uncharacterized protein YjbI with pentapeptide repeats